MTRRWASGAPVALLYLVAATAEAHVPHNDMLAGAVDAGLANAHPWVLIHATGSSTLILESTDAGDNWSAVSGPPNADLLIDAARTDDGTLVLLSDTHYWWSEDDGATWSNADLPAVGTGLAAGDGILITMDDGVALGQPGELATMATGTAFSNPSGGPGGYTAVDVDGAVWTVAGADLVALPALAEPVTASLATSSTIYAGMGSGAVSRWDGTTWAPCGPTPEAGDDHPAIVALASDDLRLLASAASRGPAVSSDDCATWTSVAAPMDTDFTNNGSAQSDAAATTELAIAGELLIQAGWDGFSASEDGGATWKKVVVLPPDYIRAVAISPNVEKDGVVLLGGYSAGVERTDDGGATWDAPGLGLTEANIQGPLAIAPDDPHTAYAIADHLLWRSDDGATTWTQPTTPFSALHGLAAGTGGELWLSGDPDPTNVFGVTGTAARSPDGGVSWAPVAGLGLTETVGAFTRTPTRICAIAAGNVACSTDDGGTWTTVYAGASTVKGVAELSSGRLIVATVDEGVYTVDNCVPTLVYDGSADPVVAVTTTDDDTVFAATRSGRLLKSVDQAASFTDVGVQLTAAVSELAARPDFAAHPDLVLGTYDGAWLLSGDTLARFGRYERLDDHSGFLTVDGTRARSDSDAAIGTCTPLPAGATVTGSVRGTVVRVWGRSDGSGDVSVTVDGTAIGSFGEKVKKQGSLLLESGTLTDAWHDVSLTGSPDEAGAEDAVCLDGVEGSADGAVLTGVRRCGCASTGAPQAGTLSASFLLFFLSALTARCRSGWRR